MARAAAQKTWSETARGLALAAWDHPATARFRGGVVASLGLALALALASYRSGDPSFDAASAGPPANLLGQTGANVADAAMQTLGMTSWAAAAMLLALGLARA